MRYHHEICMEDLALGGRLIFKEHLHSRLITLCMYKVVHHIPFLRGVSQRVDCIGDHDEQLN